MSGLPIISASYTNPVVLREPAAAMPPPASGNTAAIVRTITAEAVQQARAMDTTKAPPPKALVSQSLARSRLVGPPPAFEVNLLQHMRETRTDTERAEAARTEPLSASSTEPVDHRAKAPETETREGTDPTPASGYETLEAIAAQAQGAYQSEMDRTL